MSICIEDDHKKRASFNVKKKEGFYCSSHKTPKMVDVVYKKYEYKGCYKITNL